MALLGSLTTVRRRSVDDRRLEVTVADVSERDNGVRLRRARPTKYLGHCQDGMDAAAYMNTRALADPDFTPTALGRTVYEGWLEPAAAQVLDFEFGRPMSAAITSSCTTSRRSWAAMTSAATR